MDSLQKAHNELRLLIGRNPSTPSSHWDCGLNLMGLTFLIDSDADGERGLYLPRILSDKDPLCSPTLKHMKLAEGVYWYERKR